MHHLTVKATLAASAIKVAKAAPKNDVSRTGRGLTAIQTSNHENFNA
jgi:hypothetical protein